MISSKHTLYLTKETLDHSLWKKNHTTNTFIIYTTISDSSNSWERKLSAPVFGIDTFSLTLTVAAHTLDLLHHAGPQLVNADLETHNLVSCHRPMNVHSVSWQQNLQIYTEVTIFVAVSINDISSTRRLY